MGFFDFLKSKNIDLDDSQEKKEFKIGETPVKIFEVGSTGTEIFAGYLQEEYLPELRGKDAADKFDKMRRSDPKVKMILSAMKNPIKGAVWNVNQIGDETREGEIQQAFIEHILFKDLGKTWKSFLHEALSCIDFGYSLFEITYKAELNHEKFGSYNGIRSIAFRSQRTIEKWNINSHGELESVEQQAFGDFQKVKTIPAKYLLHFAIDREGDNFEGISILRPAYGPWLRKNTFLKLIAAGVEKYAIPTPILKVPEGKQGSEEYKKALEAMKRFVSHQCNYMTIPHGWDLELKPNPFDASKVRDIIDKENVEIVNAALANFLELGQSGSGSYALSFDLSDFFLGGLEYIAEQICETINNQLIPNLIALNFPNQKCLVELTASGISDRAGEELSRVIFNLVRSGTIKPDDRLEAHLRERYGLPTMDESTQRSAAQTPTLDDDKITLSEKSSKKKSDDLVIKSIEVGGDSIKEIMARNLDSIGESIVKESGKKWKDSNKTNFVQPPNEYSIKGLKAYQDELSEEFARIYNKAVQQAKNENKRFKNIKLSETESRITLSEFDRLSRKAKARIIGLTKTLVTAHVADLEKVARLQFIQSAESTDSLDQFEQDIRDQVQKTIAGPMTAAGGLINASTLVNLARKDFFTEMIATNEVVSFTWVNSNPVSEICKGLNGITLPANHPDVDKYWPPLHHNCKTYTVANTTTTKNNPEAQNGFTPTKTQSESITLADGHGHSCC